jgi:hypothetical protein
VEVPDALGEPPCEAELQVLPLAEAEGEAEGLGVAEGEWLALVEREAAGALGVPAPGEAEGLREALGLCEALRELELQWEALVEAVVEREPELLSESRALAVPRSLLPEAVAQRLVLTVALRLRVGLRERVRLEVAERLRVAQPEPERELAVDLLDVLVPVRVLVEVVEGRASAPGACRDSSSSAPESVGRAAAAAGCARASEAIRAAGPETAAPRCSGESALNNKRNTRRSKEGCIRGEFERRKGFRSRRDGDTFFLRVRRDSPLVVQ